MKFCGRINTTLGPLLIIGLILAVSLFASCASAQEGSELNATTPAQNGEQKQLTGCDMLKVDKENANMTKFTGMRNLSFCELILGCEDGTGALYGSAKFNEPNDPCPDQLWLTLDPEQVKKELNLTDVQKNPTYGRKFWTLDAFETNISNNVRIFNGDLEMAWWGNVEATINIVPYNPMIVGRDSIITFEKGNQVNLLTDPNGTMWIQKNYVTTPEAPMTYEQLPTLKTLLKYPTGWTFQTKVLDKDLVLTPLNKKVRIMWDDRNQSWDALDNGTVNYIP